MSADSAIREARGAVRAVRVQAVFHVADDQQAQAVAAKMVDRAHEIANLPECECDLDVTVERTPPDTAASPVDLGDVPARDVPARGRSASL